MNSVHDLGGMMGFGAIETDSTGPNFHAEWEERVFALTLAVGATGSWNIDESRHTRESLPPVQYLSAGYYQIWLAALERLIVAKKLVDQQELSPARFPIAATGIVRDLRDVDDAVEDRKGFDCVWNG